ncbi:hypothetical protein, partial [Klebsiella pneumoniae]|uniref:hypothetical protein n=1 Tax=Klebsiella pneumoniae TaxID=573 RepID=UPI001954AD94
QINLLKNREPEVISPCLRGKKRRPQAGTDQPEKSALQGIAPYSIFSIGSPFFDRLQVRLLLAEGRRQQKRSFR